MSAFVVKQPIRIGAEFFNEHGQPTDPTTVLFLVRDPDGNETQPQALRDSVGAYHAVITPTLSGIWYYRVEGTGGVEAASETSLSVEQTQFGGR